MNLHDNVMRHVAGSLVQRSFFLLSMVSILFCLSACTTFKPKPFDESTHLNRAILKSDGDISVAADILSREEAEDIFGFDFISEEIQPVWISIENKGKDPYWFIPHRLDPEYYPAMEAANIAYGSRSSDSHKAIYRHFYNVRMARYIPAGETRKGFVFTKYESGLKHIVIKVTGKTTKRFMFVIKASGPELDYQKVAFAELYKNQEIKDLDLPGLREALGKLPCCTSDAKGTSRADPLNLAIVGEKCQVMAELLGRGWDLTETINIASLYKMMLSNLFGVRYDTSPVSPLYFMGRKQDFAMQKARSSIDRRNHLRLWLSPLTFNGTSVWVGQISRDIRVKFTTKSPYLVTHEVSSDVDEARHYIVEDLMASNAVEKIGYVRISEPVTMAAPRRNLTDDEYFTDGLMAVVFLADRYIPYHEITFLEWEKELH